MSTAASPLGDRCPWCDYNRQVGSAPPGPSDPDCAEHATVRREYLEGLAELARQTTARLATERAAWDATEATAAERGACLDCLRSSPWRTAPRYVRHRKPGMHASAVREIDQAAETGLRNLAARRPAVDTVTTTKGVL